MRIILGILGLVCMLYAAEVNKALYSENNVSMEINHIRQELNQIEPHDEQQKNQLDIQKLFLSKIEVLSKRAPQGDIQRYHFKDADKISQEEFLQYFTFNAHYVQRLIERNKNEKQISKRLEEIKENLDGMEPSQTSEILQGQLEYAYFKWKKIHNSKRIEQYRNYLNKEKMRFRQLFSRVEFDLQALDKRTIEQNETLQKLYQQKIYIELRLEKEAILLASQQSQETEVELNGQDLIDKAKEEQKDSRSQFLQSALEDVKEKISKQIEEKNKTLILMQVHYLRDQDLENYILVRDIMQSFISDLSAQAKETFETQMKMLEWLKYEEIGDVAAMMYDFSAWFDNVYEETVSLVNTPLFYQQDRAIVIFDFIKMLMTIIIGFMIARFYKRRINIAQKRVGVTRRQSFKVAGNIGYYLIVIITFAISLHNIGLDLSSISLVAGALSVGIGFGLKEVVGNFVSGLILMVERSVKIGDFVEIENGVSGNIIDIRMRSVTIKTPANIDVVVPNSSLVQRSFINYTLEEAVRRLSVPFTIAYGVEFSEVEEKVLKALSRSDLPYMGQQAGYEPSIIITGMDEHGVNCQLFVYVDTYGPDVRSPFFKLIYKTLQENGFPLPSTRTNVTMKTLPEQAFSSSN